MQTEKVLLLLMVVDRDQLHHSSPMVLVSFRAVDEGMPNETAVWRNPEGWSLTPSSRVQGLIPVAKGIHKAGSVSVESRGRLPGPHSVGAGSSEDNPTQTLVTGLLFSSLGR